MNNQQRINDFFKVDRCLRLRTGIWPLFERTVLQEGDEFQISIDEHGALVKQFKGASLETRCQNIFAPPVTSREQWKRFARER